MATAIDRLTVRVRRLARLGAEVQDLAVDLATELTIVRKSIADDSTGRLDATIELALLRAADARRKATLRAASTGAWKMEMRFNGSGAALVRVDEGKWFRLARGDARLLSVLTRSNPVDADGFPSWQTYAQLAEELGRKAGVLPTRRALVESVFRIRRALKGVDLNPYLLRVDRKLGRLKFLLRSGPHDAHGHGSG
jgi:hypothetical protein